MRKSPRRPNGTASGGSAPIDPAASQAAPPEEAFRSVSSSTLADLLHRSGISLAVSTYGSGRVVLVRAEDATHVNTHFRSFKSPMGIALGPRSLALGCSREIWDFRNHPGLSDRRQPPRPHDACFLPRNIHVTGDIRVHELGFAGDELWVVNTLFSTLCTLDADCSFVPRWRPPFISQLAPEDRCHLNGLAIVDGRVRYVTALGETDTERGWRDQKATGGVLIDVDSGETVVGGLCMPHSPRWYQDTLWLLEGGKGTLAKVDLAARRVETVAELPGFTRGLAFAGPYAFIGLSQVRESNVFGGLPIVERLPERCCGVWVVDLRDARPVAFLRFEGTVQEIFDVQVLHGIRYPEIVLLPQVEAATTYVIPDEAWPDLAIAG